MVFLVRTWCMNVTRSAQNLHAMLCVVHICAAQSDVRLYLAVPMPLHLAMCPTVKHDLALSSGSGYVHWRHPA